MVKVRTITPSSGRMSVNSSSGNSKKPSIIDRIKPIQFSDDEGIKILMYGESSSGKTSLWATFPKPILAIVCSGGSKPGELKSLDTPYYRQTIKQVTLEKSDELKELIPYMKDSEYKTVVIDHVSGLQDIILREILGLELLPEQKFWGLASIPQYGQCTNISKDYLRDFLSLSQNIVCVAHQREFSTEGLSEVAPTIGPGVAPTLAMWLNGAVDYNVQTFKRPKEIEKKTKIKTAKGKIIEKIQREKTDKPEYCLRTGPSTTYASKFRIPKESVHLLPEVIVDPDYDKILTVITAARNFSNKT